MGLPTVSVILLGPLGLLPSGELGSTLEVESHKLVGNPTHHLKAVLSCLESDLKGGTEAIRGTTVKGVEEGHWNCLPKFQLSTIEVWVVDLWLTLVPHSVTSNLPRSSPFVGYS